MFSALDWSLSGHLQLLRFRLHKIDFRFGFAGCLYLYLVRANEIDRLGSRSAGQPIVQSYSTTSNSATKCDFDRGGKTSQVSVSIAKCEQRRDFWRATPGN